MDHPGALAIEVRLDGAAFRIGPIGYSGEQLVIVPYTRDRNSWQRVEETARLLGIRSEKLTRRARGPTFPGGGTAQLLLVPLPVQKNLPTPEALARALRNALDQPDLAEEFASLGDMPSIWLGTETDFMSLDYLSEFLTGVMQIFNPASRPYGLGDPQITIATRDLDEKEFGELASRVEGFAWQAEPGPDSARPAAKRARRRASQTAQKAPEEGIESGSIVPPDTPPEPEPAPEPDPTPEPPRPGADPDPDTTINDADFRLDRPVDGVDQDTLDRQAIAEAIAQKVVGVWQSYQTKPADADEHWQPGYPRHPFIVHLAGRWGSGKSSILNFIAQLLKGDHPDPEHRTDYQVALPPPAGEIWSGHHKDWVVVEFNAWRQQGSGHAWWALMTALAAEAPGQIGGRGARFSRRDAWWRFSSSWRNWIIGGAAVLTLLLFWWAFSGTDGGTLGDALKAIGGILTAIVGIVAFTGNFAARSKRTAEAIQNLEIDPTAALKKRFEEMIAEIHNPVAIFIDDLDRCNATYVVELLQAIQTVYADVPVLYIVAADRDWLVSAYDQIYDKFTGAISKKGQPLGYLFVKKIFQLSVNVPDLSLTDQREFLRSLLPGNETGTAARDDVRKIESQIAEAPTVQAKIAIVRDQSDPRLQRAAARAATPDLTTARSTAQITHLLIETLARELPDGASETPPPSLLDPNPRSITRLVNAYSFRLGYALRAAEFDVIDKLPYWCVLDLRFPYAAKLLAETPELADGDTWQTASEDAFPKADHSEIGQILEKLDSKAVTALRRFG